jgi:RNA polymerase sigma factor (sigma-70 family)
VTATTLTGADADAQFAELLERHRGIVFKVAATYCRNPADREDVAQEIVTQLWRAFPRFDATRPFSTWMYRIALNVAISFVRASSVRERHTVALDETHDVEDSSAIPSDEDERAKLLYAFVDGLDAWIAPCCSCISRTAAIEKSPKSSGSRRRTWQRKSAV